jgi:hypothetical protein
MSVQKVNKEGCCNVVLKKFTSMMADYFSFHAPSPPNYSIKTNYSDNKNNYHSKAYKEITIQLNNGDSLEKIASLYPCLEINCYLVSKLNRDKYNKDSSGLVLIEIINKNTLPGKCYQNMSNTNILFCHGNATDLGKSVGFLFDLASQLKCSVFSFDYTGYGQSLGNPTELAVYKDMETILNFLTDHKPKPIKLNNLVL